MARHRVIGNFRVSLGHVSNVRTGDRSGMGASVGRWSRLSEPDALLDAWRDSYTAPPGERLQFPHAIAWQRVRRRGPRRAARRRRPRTRCLRSFLGGAVASRSPYGRTGTQLLLCRRPKVCAEAQAALKLASKRENVAITVPKDLGLLADTIEPAPGGLTSPIQTHLDLSIAGERGAEAADHLRRPGSHGPNDTPGTTVGRRVRRPDDRGSEIRCWSRSGQILGSFKGRVRHHRRRGSLVCWPTEDMPHVGTLDVDVGLDAEALGDGEIRDLDPRASRPWICPARGTSALPTGSPGSRARWSDRRRGRFPMPRATRRSSRTIPADQRFCRAAGRWRRLGDAVLPTGRRGGGRCRTIGTNRVEIAVCSIPRLLAMKATTGGPLQTKDA